MAPTATTRDGSKLFLHNMRALWRVDPSLASLVDAVDDEERLSVESAKSGARTVRVTGENGTSIYLHSRHDPEAEAERFAEAVPTANKYCFIVNGLGLGYHVRALFERLSAETLLICTEPSIPTLATALCHVDLHEALASGRLVFLFSEDKARIHARLKPFNTLIMLGTQLAPHPPSVQTQGIAHAAINTLIKEFVAFTRMSLMTLVSNSKITCKNVAMNLVHYVSTPPIDLLRDRFAGNPAVVISAGPSLSRNIEQLADLKGRALLCAVQTALKPLMQKGIVPDFVTTLDFHEMSRKFFEGVEGLENVWLVAEPKANWNVLDPYPGPVSILENSWARLVIGDELGGRGGLPAGATVSHLAFYLAAYLGCDPIIFVGQDLAYTGHVFYVPGVEIHQAWQSELNRFSTMEQKEWDRIVRNQPILRRVTGDDGKMLYTDELLFTYLEQFEKDIAGVSRRVINATEGGARIRGTEVMTLRQAASSYCQNPIDLERFAYREATARRDRSKLEPACGEVKKRIAELEEVETVCNELLTLLTELGALVEDPPRFNRRLVRVDELRTQVHQQTRPYMIVSAAMQLAEFRRYSADRKIESSQTKDADRARKQLARDIEFITSVRDGAREVIPILALALKRLEEPPFSP